MAPFFFKERFFKSDFVRHSHLHKGTSGGLPPRLLIIVQDEIILTQEKCSFERSDDFQFIAAFSNLSNVLKFWFLGSKVVFLGMYSFSYSNPTQPVEIQCEKVQQFSSNKHCENSDNLVWQESKLVSLSFRSVYCSILISQQRLFEHFREAFSLHYVLLPCFSNMTS